MTIDATALFDAHMHTEYAHCSADTSVDAILERMDEFGVPSFGIVEHADQLYFPEEGFWLRADTNQLPAMRRSRAERHSRHEQFRNRVQSLRSDRVFVGLECEAEDSGVGLAVLEEDLRGYDYLIGGLHFLKRSAGEALDQRETVKGFTARTQQLIRGGIEILAHPFRLFRREDRPVPTDLYGPVAEMLKAEGVAAEINFQCNQPDPAFFMLCLELGVRVSIGSDSHSIAQIGDLSRHIALLGELGITDRTDEALWKPPATR